MAKAHTTWQVLPHGDIGHISERVWQVRGTIARIPLQRVMTIARRSDGELVVHNPICVEDKLVAAIEQLGPIAVIVVPSGSHRLDARVFKDRFPEARVICPSGARDKVAEVVAVDGTYADEPADSAVWFEPLDGVKHTEGAMFVRDGNGLTVVLNDILFNMPHLTGVSGFILRRITKSSGGPRVSRIARWFLIDDKAALKASFERLAAMPELARICVAHHEVIDQDPAKVLREVAATL